MPSRPSRPVWQTTSSFLLFLLIPARPFVVPKWSAPPPFYRYAKPNDGQVGQGPNWIERSFPVTADEIQQVDPKKVEDYNLGIDGQAFGTGKLSKRMHQAIVSRSSFGNDPQVSTALKLYAMDFTAKEAVRAALKQNGLELVLGEDEQDEGLWGDIDSIRLDDDDDIYDSVEEAVEYWEPGEPFSFVARQVPAKMAELSLDQLLQALDPEGKFRQEAKENKLDLIDEDLQNLKALADLNVRRAELAPMDSDAYAGADSPGYNVISAARLAEPSEPRTMHVMDAFVSHGCLVVDLSNGGTNDSLPKQFSKMWKAATEFFDYVDTSERFVIPALTTAPGAKSEHAKIGYVKYDDMEFLETRSTRSGDLLPKECSQVVDTQSLQESFDVVAAIGKQAVETVVAASTQEASVLDAEKALASAKLLASELLDDGKPIVSDIECSEGTTSMSPHRLCRYHGDKQEVFGAHTDSTFITAVPVASVAGLEVYDESAEQWYQPELAARRHFRAIQASKGDDPDAETTSDGLPWHSNYLVLMPGELLQIASRDEILASVHRVVRTPKPRLSRPILLRGRPGTRFDCGRYLGFADTPLLQSCDNMTIEDIHAAMQVSSSRS